MAYLFYAIFWFLTGYVTIWCRHYTSHGLVEVYSRLEYAVMCGYQTHWPWWPKGLLANWKDIYRISSHWQVHNWCRIDHWTHISTLTYTYLNIMRLGCYYLIAPVAEYTYQVTPLLAEPYPAKYVFIKWNNYSGCEILILWFQIMSLAILTIWARGVGPRFRPDQLSDLTWKDLLIFLSAVFTFSITIFY